MRRIILLIMLTCTLPALAAEDVLIKTPDDATLSARFALPSGTARVPTILEFNIYADPDVYTKRVEEIAARGYAAVIADARGKRLSPDAPAPYEKEVTDTHAVLDWIARQPWSDGRVGMIGGSYSGFTAWAATKKKHPALKAIAVSAAAIPGQGLPMYNNVFLSANYGWAFYVTNNKLLDDSAADRQRWNTMGRNWFLSGRPYRELDAVDGTPNPWLQRWLTHPSFDAYWQAMVPYARDFAHIDIPVLTITGYYDDGQISALQYLTEHYKYRRNPEHYLVIGPYDHFGTHAQKKPEVLREYTIDAAAQMDSQELKLAFMDYVLRGAPKPALLADRMNYEVMGANEWRHVPTLAAMHGAQRRLYFSQAKTEGLYSLADTAPPADTAVTHIVNFADRDRMHGYHAYPVTIIQGPLSYVTEAVFQSAPIKEGATISGSFSGELAVRINKKDFDYCVTVYQGMPDGKLFHLGYSLNRASYAFDATKRTLLTPGKLVRLPFSTTLVSRRLEPGSVLLVLVDGVKHPGAQVNYGTGKDVSDESVKDADVPLQIQIAGGSFVDVPFDLPMKR